MSYGGDLIHWQQECVWFGFFVWWHINFHGLFNAKYVLREQKRYYLTQSWENKGVHNIIKTICLKVNVIVGLDFDMTNNDLTIQRLDI